MKNLKPLHLYLLLIGVGVAALVVTIQLIGRTVVLSYEFSATSKPMDGLLGAIAGEFSAVMLRRSPEVPHLCS
jgi:hypothetical protein